MLNTLSLAQLT